MAAVGAAAKSYRNYRFKAISSLTPLTLYFYNTIQLNLPFNFNSRPTASLYLKKVSLSDVRFKWITGPAATSVYRIGSLQGYSPKNMELRRIDS